ncbi:hypothetical protein E3N88_18484 [Mikania micrantha]|uniref:Uncharacterized protein n=1 Tax=Mikania micrantha TaxID=192012 RepID=A0A5N6NNA2_9ASTR|nr:hypothetical protein E3N88_18484 [Mikania micrantha]
MDSARGAAGVTGWILEAKICILSIFDLKFSIRVYHRISEAKICILSIFDLNSQPEFIKNFRGKDLYS